MKTLVVKLIATLDLSEISYLITEFVSTYILLGYKISISTTIVAWMAYLVVANIMLKKSKMFS
ncbi:MAG TPA: hypothetical protein VJR94_12470 [Candidatus Nitrosocosmicus sp.]|nr:hypothetical protein [Candidatus Nitrosocosmicus sp.]